MRLYKNKILSFVLFTAVLFVLNGSEFLHNHSAFNHEDNCSACIINFTLANSDITQPLVLKSFLNFEYINIPENTDKPDLQPIINISNRAPPSII